MKTEEFAELGIPDIVKMITTGKVSAEEITTACLRQAREVDRVTNCFVEIEEESAMAAAQSLDRRQARGEAALPLHGVPLAHKDMYSRRNKPRGFIDTGLPVAFQLIARPFAEGILLRTADGYQRVTGWRTKSPSLTDMRKHDDPTSATTNGLET